MAKFLLTKFKYLTLNWAEQRYSKTTRCFSHITGNTQYHLLSVAYNKLATRTAGISVETLANVHFLTD